jgi:hypothetical protein
VYLVEGQEGQRWWAEAYHYHYQYQHHHDYQFDVRRQSATILVQSTSQERCTSITDRISTSRLSLHAALEQKDG